MKSQNALDAAEVQPPLVPDVNIDGPHAYRAGKLDSRSLRYFVTIADCGSVRSASDRIGISQPGLSKSIRALEETLRLQLFSRHPGGVRLTPHGEVFASQARQVLAALDNIERDVRQSAQLERGSLRLGTTPTAETIIANIMREFSHQHPQVNIMLEVGSPDKLSHKVESCELDFLVSNDETLHLTDGLKCRVLRHDKVVFCAARRHPLAKQVNINFQEVRGSRLIMPFLTPRLIAWLADKCFFAEDSLIGTTTCNNYELIARLLQDGQSVSIAPRYAIEQLAPYFDIVALDVLDMDYEVGLAYVIPATGLLSSPAQKMLAMITSATTRKPDG